MPARRARARSRRETSTSSSACRATRTPPSTRCRTCCPRWRLPARCRRSSRSWPSSARRTGWTSSRTRSRAASTSGKRCTASGGGCTTRRTHRTRSRAICRSPSWEPSSGSPWRTAPRPAPSSSTPSAGSSSTSSATPATSPASPSSGKAPSANAPARTCPRTRSPSGCPSSNTSSRRWSTPRRAGPAARTEGTPAPWRATLPGSWCGIGRGARWSCSLRPWWRGWNGTGSCLPGSGRGRGGGRRRGWWRGLRRLRSGGSSGRSCSRPTTGWIASGGEFSKWIRSESRPAFPWKSLRHGHSNGLELPFQLRVLGWCEATSHVSAREPKLSNHPQRHRRQKHPFGAAEFRKRRRFQTKNTAADLHTPNGAAMSVPKTAAEPVRAPTLLDRLSSIVDGTDLSKVQYLTALDNSFLVGEDEGHSTAVAGLYIFRKRIPPEVVLKTVGDYAVSGSSRMMSRVVLNKWMFGRPYYQRGADFDARNHFEIVQVPAPGGKAELELVAGQLQGRFLDFEYPPWKAFYLDGVDGGNGCAIYWMSHHCLADGQGFVRTLLGYVMSVDENGNPRKDKVDLKSMQYAAGRFAKLEGGKEKPPATPIRDLVAALVRAWIGIALFVVQSFLLLFVFRKRSLVQPEFKVLPQKQLAYSNKIMMEDLKAAKNHYQCTINDLMVTASSGAVQKYLEHKQVLRDRELVYMIPTSVRRADDFSISNTTSAWLFPVTATKEDPVERLSSVAWRFNLYKQSWEPWVYYWTSPYTLPLTFPWMLPKPDPRIVAQLNTLTGVITNVPGPSKPIYWAGVPFDQYVPVLCPGANIIGTALQSLNDHITLGVTLDFDPDASPQGLFARDDARLIVSLFESEVSRLFQSAKKGQPRRKSVIEVLIPEDARDAVLRKQDDIVVPGEDGAADGDGGFETVETSGTKRIAEGVPVEGVKLPGLRSTDSILVAAAAQAVSA